MIGDRVDRAVSPATVPQSILRTGGEPQAHGVLPGPALGESPHEIAFC